LGVSASRYVATGVHAVRGDPARPSMQSKAPLRAQLYVCYLLVDLAMVGLAVVAASALRLGLAGGADLARSTLILVLPLYLLIAFNVGAFQIRTLTSTAFSLQRALVAYMGALTTTVLLLFFLKASEDYSRLAFALLFVVGLAFVAVGRVATRLLARRLLNDRVETTVRIMDGPNSKAVDADVVLDAAAHRLSPDVFDPAALDRLGWYVKGADRVVVDCPPHRRADWAGTLKGLGVGAEIVTPELDAVGAIGTGLSDGRATVIVGRGPLGTRDRILKRAFDLALVLATAPLTLPLCLTVAVAIRIDSPGPVLFAQVRVGRGNRQFRMLKFRSMRHDRSDGSGAVSTLRADDRVTRVGRFIRAASLDELPQLWNVLRGEMSVVGPRPHALASTAESSLFWEIDARYWQRHAAKPGLTGLAQIRGFRGATEHTGAVLDRVQSDLEYLAEWSIWRDLRIIFWTLRVLVHPNAY
jgi:lipopolysaccharide/colanic/teichoic acid biosynthesis glycosyltransferase